MTKTQDGEEIVEHPNHFLVYLYDESGAPIGLQYRNKTYEKYDFDTYYFEKNLQGDIIAIYTEAGAKIGSYTYDAWGNCTSSYATGATTAQKKIVQMFNPFRYRGYYYDYDTGLYYLQSRYYNPATGRFLNADGYVSTGTGLLGYNMYAYCDNNPVMYVDPMGFAVYIDLDCDGENDLFPNNELDCIGGGGYSYSVILPSPWLSVYEYGYTEVMHGSGISSTYSAWANTQRINEAWINSSYNTPDIYYPATSSHSKVHGNSKLSQKSQIGYEIYERSTGKVAKTGISGRPLNKNGSSTRANIQVNAFNKEVGYPKYAARIVMTGMPNRMVALEWEAENANRLRAEGHPMDRHRYP